MLFNVYTDYGFCHEVAMKYSISAAMVLNRIAWSINYHAENEDKWRDKYYLDDQWWMDNTYEAIAKHFRGLISARTVKAVILEFEKDAILIAKKIDNGTWNQTKWYAIDEEKYAAITKKSMIMHRTKNVPSNGHKMSHRTDIKCPIEETKNVPSSYSNSLTNSPTKSSSNTLLPVDNFQPRLESDLNEAQERGRGEESIEKFEEFFGKKVSIAERKKFADNLAAVDLSHEEVLKRITRLAEEPLLKISTQSLNRIFYLDEAEKWLWNVNAELRGIKAKAQIMGQFSPEVWKRLILESKFAKGCSFAPHEDILVAASISSLGVTWTEPVNEPKELIAEDSLENNEDVDDEWSAELRAMEF